MATLKKKWREPQPDIRFTNRIVEYNLKALRESNLKAELKRNEKAVDRGE